MKPKLKTLIRRWLKHHRHADWLCLQRAAAAVAAAPRCRGMGAILP